MQTNANITLYNIVTIKDVRTVYRTEIYGVNRQGKTKSSAGENGLNTAKETRVFIPFTSIDQTGKEYLEPVAFRSEGNRGNYITFNEGDIVVRGICPYDLQNGSVKELMAQYDNVLTVLNVDKLDNGSYRMQHFELGVG